MVKELVLFKSEFPCYLLNVVPLFIADEAVVVDILLVFHAFLAHPGELVDDDPCDDTQHDYLDDEVVEVIGEESSDVT